MAADAVFLADIISLKDVDDHDCFGAAAVGHITDDADARGGRTCCAL
jgi:hypothetical protein